MGNPYRQPKPKPDETIFGGKFYLANEKGSYGFRTSPINLALCREYLWVTDNLTIPLSSITHVELSKHGGRIRFWDEIAKSEMEFNFTKIGFLRFKRREVESFLQILETCLQNESPTVSEKSSIQVADNSCLCEVCGVADISVYVFYVLRFVGIAPVAYAYRLTPMRFVLCPGHARKQAVICCLRTAATGYLGFPGILAAPWYVLKNLWALRRARADNACSIILGLFCIILPWATITTLIILLMNDYGSD